MLHPGIRSRAVVVRTAFEVTGRLFFTLALAYTTLSATSAILQATPLVVVLGTVLFLGERPDAATLAGGAIVVGSGVYAVLRGRR